MREGGERGRREAGGGREGEKRGGREEKTKKDKLKLLAKII